MHEDIKHGFDFDYANFDIGLKLSCSELNQPNSLHIKAAV